MPDSRPRTRAEALRALANAQQELLALYAELERREAAASQAVTLRDAQDWAAALEEEEAALRRELAGVREELRLAKDRANEAERKEKATALHLSEAQAILIAIKEAAAQEQAQHAATQQELNAEVRRSRQKLQDSQKSIDTAAEKHATSQKALRGHLERAQAELLCVRDELSKHEETLRTAVAAALRQAQAQHTQAMDTVRAEFAKMLADEQQARESLKDSHKQALAKSKDREKTAWDYSNQYEKAYREIRADLRDESARVEQLEKMLSRRGANLPRVPVVYQPPVQTARLVNSPKAPTSNAAPRQSTNPLPPQAPPSQSLRPRYSANALDEVAQLAATGSTRKEDLAAGKSAELRRAAFAKLDEIADESYEGVRPYNESIGYRPESDELVELKIREMEAENALATEQRLRGQRVTAQSLRPGTDLVSVAARWAWDTRREYWRDPPKGRKGEVYWAVEYTTLDDDSEEALRAELVRSLIKLYQRQQR